MDKEKKLNSNIIIYVDYENIHTILKKYHTNLMEKDFLNILKKHCADNNYTILDIIVYCNFDIADLHESMHQTWLLQNNVEIRHTANKSKNYADLQITIDVLEQVFYNNLADGFIIVSSDKDMMPLVKAIKRRGKFIELITTVKDCDYGVTVFPSTHFTLEGLLGITNPDGSEIKYTPSSAEDDIMRNLNEFVPKQITAGHKHINIKYYQDSLMPRLKLLKYEVFKALQNLESQTKIVVYEYQGPGSKQTAIIDAANFSAYQTYYRNALTVVPNYYSTTFIQNSYNT